MPVQRVPWSHLPRAVCAAVEAGLGTGAYVADDVHGGGNSALATVLRTADGRAVFVKGTHLSDDQAEELSLEHRINAYLPDRCPRVLWRVAAAGWTLLGFDAVTGAEADFAEGADLGACVAALTELSGVPAPPLPLLTAWERWGYYCADADEPRLEGDRLMHTDLAATNILIADGRAHLVDWSWAARGPAWADACLWAIRLLSDGGHTPAQAAAWAARIPAFRAAAPAAVAVLAKAEAARWADLHADGTPGIDGVTRGARIWADHWSPHSRTTA